MQLFTHLPEKIFEPLASKNRHLYELSLQSVFEEFYSDTREAPTRDEVIAVIASVIQSRPDLWHDEDDEAVEGDVKKQPSTRARAICNRLTECGWFETNKSGYRVLLEFSPVSLHLMQSLSKISSGSVQRLEGVMQTLRSVLSNLKSGNLALTAALTQCAMHLSDIRMSMRSTRTNMARIRSDVFKIRGRDERLRFLMESYVGGVFTQDLSRLMSDRHPWRLRRQIMNVIEEFLNDETQMMNIGLEYALDNFSITMSEGSAAEKLRAQEEGRQMAYRGFHNLKEELSAIEDIAKSIQSLQRKLDELLYVQATVQSVHSNANTDRLEEAMTRFAGVIGSTRKAGIERREPMPAVLAEKTLHLSDAVLRTPNVRRKPQASIVAEEPLSPIAVFRQQLNDAYHDRIHVSDARIIEFLQNLMGDEDEYSFREDAIATIDDFIAASAVVSMALSEQVPPRIEALFRLSFDDELQLVETDYMSFPRVTIKKIRKHDHVG